MPGSARISDIVGAGGVITSGSSNVLVNGLGKARVGDSISAHFPCPLIIVHCAAVLSQGSATVLTNGIKPSRLGDGATCGDTVVSASSNVIINS
jgi:uncharacterized Zn-binding protein involved in type VI secretion